ncbi:MAG: hypothetical protein LUG60_12065 [Erysipelotrichaceae bacterium]|nr:hypothetical protein [Erysipelotrichaceae bacterium]
MDFMENFSEFYIQYMNGHYLKVQEEISKQGIYGSFRSDLFLHHALNKNSDILRRLCEDIKGCKIDQITIENSKPYILSITNKQLELDTFVSDNEGLGFNFEFQNYDLNLEGRKRMSAYGNRLSEEQIKRGVSYKDSKPCFQEIYYFGNPLPHFNGFKDDIMKKIDSSNVRYDGDVLTSTLYTMTYLENYLNGKETLTFTEQFWYLLKNDYPYPYLEPDKKIKELIKMHEDYLATGTNKYAEFLEDAQNKANYVEMEKIRAESFQKGEDSGFKKTYSNCTQSLAETLKNLLISKFHEVSMEIEQCIERASFEALNNAILNVQFIQMPEEIIRFLI